MSTVTFEPVDGAASPVAAPVNPRTLVGRASILLIAYMALMQVFGLLSEHVAPLVGIPSAIAQPAAQIIGLTGAAVVLAATAIPLIRTRTFWLGEPSPQAHKRMTPRRALMLVATMLLIQCVSTIISSLLQTAFGLVGVQLKSASMEGINGMVSDSWLMVVAVVLVGPLVEEIVCRGLILRSLAGRGKMFALTTSAVLFGLMHGDVLQGLFAVMLGLLLGYVAMEYSLLWAIVLHCVTNAFATFMAQVAGGQSPEVTVVIGLALIVVYIVSAVLLFRRRSAIREYIAANRSLRGSYVGWASPWFLLVVAYFAVCAFAGFSLM
ncbi:MULTISPECIES: CPBP family intramembrane glutamic endopeptidase [Bifidobacterium]|uniref:CPBP family intramembrane glutamic endopeptidase n=1 Tax=Bifidobacterium TaxID=1678 RepID=UPI001BDC3F40|nr:MULTISPECIES: type II CAAX endopeptidase family protein [Bifidobacterium]MBT1162695.1 CPBP family intramembrane metalloprotease [Bifidobacterium sp. SO1]MBW3079722.1 CPBP family intramembrane metalloprotease [Bifidobacterium simiiventris]